MSKKTINTIKIIITILIGAVLIIMIIGLVASHYYREYYIENKYPMERSNTKIVNLSQQINPNSKIIVFETPQVTISFESNGFEKYLKQLIEKNEKTKSNQDLLTFIEEQTKNKDRIEINNVIKELGLYTEIELYIADLLENGEGMVFDKNQNAYVDKIEIENFGYLCGPLCGFGGRNYKLPNNNSVFLKVFDWIS